MYWREASWRPTKWRRYSARPMRCSSGQTWPGAKWNQPGADSGARPPALVARRRLLPRPEWTASTTLQNHSAAFTRLLVDPRLVERAAELIGPNVQLHHTKLHNKPPAVGSPFPMHQDYPYFPHEGDSMIAAVLHLDDASVENGCLCVVPRSHKLGPIEHCHDGSFYLPLEDWPLERAVPVEASAGDVLFFGYCMVHGSYVNRSARSRRILLIQMRSPTDRPLNDAHRSPGQGTMLLGTNPDASQL